MKQLNNYPINNVSSALLSNRHKQSKKVLYNTFKKTRYSADLIQKRLPVSFTPISVCDIGAGYGALAFSFALKGIKTVAVEPFKDDRLLINHLLKKYPKAKKFLKIVNAKAEYLPFNNSSFDLCLLSQVLEHVENPMNAIKEASRVLKPGGYIYLTAPNYFFPIEQHYHLLYFPLMPKELLYLWVLFYFKYLKKQRFSKNDLKEISDFIINLNYTNHIMIKSLFKINNLKLVWSASDENMSLLKQIHKHWKTNPRIASIPSILISIPLKIIRKIFTYSGILPKKLEYVAIKVNNFE